MARQSFSLGGVLYPTKTAATARLRAILNNAPLSREITDEADFATLLDLIHLHPEAEEKIGAGVRSFEVRVDPVWKTRQFWVLRDDGTETDFSFVVCLSPKLGSPEANARRALRNEIEPQIASFRAERCAGGGVVVDEVTGQPIPPGLLHIDHASPTFDTIQRAWLAARKLELVAIETTGHGDGETVILLADRELARDWQRYHLDHARLRCVARFTNLSTLRRGAA
jgi:hypothetical protein